MAEKTDFRSMYDREYIGSFDLPEGGDRDLVLTIKRVAGGELTAIGGRKSKKPIVSFKENVKPLICNKTNGKTIAALYGNFVEAWAGKRITLYRSRTRSPDGGEDVDCIRVRPAAPTGAASQASFATGDEEQQFVSSEQAQELEELCKARGVEEKFLAQAKVEQFAHVLAVDYAGGKKWIEKQPVREPAATES